MLSFNVRKNPTEGRGGYRDNARKNSDFRNPRGKRCCRSKRSYARTNPKRPIARWEGPEFSLTLSPRAALLSFEARSRQRHLVHLEAWDGARQSPRRATGLKNSANADSVACRMKQWLMGDDKSENKSR